MDKVEKLARIIAEAHVGMPADTLVSVGEPLRVAGLNGFVAPREDFVRPLWATYSWVAQRVLDVGFDCPDDPKLETDEARSDAPDEEIPEDGSVPGIDRALGLWNVETPSQMDEWRERMGLA